MKKKYNTVIFDLDGTLLDTLQDLTNSVNHVMSMLSYEQKTLDQIRCFVGNGINVMMERCLPDGRENPDFENAMEKFKEYYAKHAKDNTRPYDGIMELTEALKTRGIKMAIVSNKVDFAVKELNREYWNGVIDVAIGESPTIKRKPAPDTVFEALKELGADKHSTVYVGDSEVDIATAGNAGLDCISVAWGFRSKEFLMQNGASTVIEKPYELLEVIA